MKKSISVFLLLCCMAAQAQQTSNELTVACIACHGVEGVSNNDLWPNLAGQQEGYLLKELTAFRDGTRVDPIMSAAFLAGMDDPQLLEVAKYYAAFPQASAVTGKAPLAGETVRARCVSCHGMTGNTVTSIWPNLAGQRPGYLKKQLLDYKSGKRSHPIMHVIANELTDQQIDDVSEFFQHQ